MEYAHHGDPLVPRQQRFGKYTRSVMKGLGVPVENRTASVRRRSKAPIGSKLWSRRMTWTPVAGWRASQLSTFTRTCRTMQ